MSLRHILASSVTFPALLNIPVDKLTRYISLVRHLKPRIAFTLPSTWNGPPSCLPFAIHAFFALALELDEHEARTCWTTLKDIAWDEEVGESDEAGSLIPLLLEHGHACGLAVYEFYPPVRKCIQPNCASNPQLRIGDDAPDLCEPSQIDATVFTKNYGALPAHAISTYCRGCLSRYHHNYVVRDGTRLYYPPGVSPQTVLQVAPHFLLEAKLCERFVSQMLNAWTSAQNCARIYNDEAASYPWSPDLPLDWAYTYKLRPELVSEAFVNHCLVDWHREQGTPLEVPHQGRDHGARWNDAITARNVALAGTGQPAWNHACDLCTKHVQNKDGDVIHAYRSVVTDGISLGHPCCAVHDCKEPLVSSKDRVCTQHTSAVNKCAVVACRAMSEPSYRTCAIPTHRAAEDRLLAKGKGMEHLKQRLARMDAAVAAEKAAAINPDSTLESPTAKVEEEEEIVVDEDGTTGPACDDKPKSGLRKVFARFGRRRTHNEELCVGSCGVILGRATFYGAEGPRSVVEFWKNLFPTKKSLPSVMWYDTNCIVSAMLEKDGDTYFEDVAKPVDVFHFRAKHRIVHKYCGQNCNPAMWPGLMDENTGKWVFNSSAAEQVNSWFGGFKSITRLMRQDRYNFFLDEMILRRNRYIIQQLEEKGHAPYLIPHKDLLGSESMGMCM